MQGERIENPEYIMENNLKLDYEFYITNNDTKYVNYQTIDHNVNQKNFSKTFELT